MARARFVIVTTATVSLVLSLLLRLSGTSRTLSLLGISVLHLLAIILVWPIVVLLNDLRDATVVRRLGAEIAPKVKTGTFLNVGFILKAIRYQGRLLPGQLIDPMCEK
jgi:hypothetical protein